MKMTRFPHRYCKTSVCRVQYLDRIEAAGFNRLPAPYLNGSMWSMQYFHKTNAIGGCNAYGLPFECCVSNGNQGWPRFTQHMYLLRGIYMQHL